MTVITRLVDEPPDVAAFGAGSWDCFRIAPVPPDHPPRAWAALSLAGAQAAGGAFGKLGWGEARGLELAPRGTSGTLVGWRIREDTADRLVLDADGPRLAGRMIFARVEDGVEWTTLVRSHGAAGRRIWGVLVHAHRALVPWCLGRAEGALAHREVRQPA